MNKQREAMEIALKVIDHINTQYALPSDLIAIGKAKQAIREALAEPEQEPVAWLSQGGDVSRSKKHFDEMGFVDSIPLYTVPPTQKSLNDEEVDKIIAEHVTITDQHLLAAVYMAIRGAEQAHGIGSD